MSSDEFCLVMMVKNEAGFVTRAIESALNSDFKFTSVAIVDFGSNDNTCAEVRCIEVSNPGICFHVCDREWPNSYAHARNIVLDFAEECLQERQVVTRTWIVMLDGKDTICGKYVAIPEYATALDVTMVGGSIVWGRTNGYLFGSRYRYVGRVHEHLEGPNNAAVVSCGMQMIVHFKQQTKEEQLKKYWKYHALLTEDIDDVSQASWKPRNTFYLAQTLSILLSLGERCGQEFCEVAYSRLMSNEGYKDEAYVSGLYLLKLAPLGLLGTVASPDQIVSRCCDLNWSRLEAPYFFLKRCRTEDDWASKYSWNDRRVIGARVASCHWNGGGLFIDQEICSWMYADEYGLAAFYSGDRPAALSSSCVAHYFCRDENSKKRIASNIEFMK